MTNKTDRRDFLKLIGSSALAAAAPVDFSRTLAIPAHNRTGTIADVEHIVILMQENRSFDHYFGTMRGVRGFADPRAVTNMKRLPRPLSSLGRPSARYRSIASPAGSPNNLVILKRAKAGKQANVNPLSERPDFFVQAGDGVAPGESSIAALVNNCTDLTFLRMNLSAGKGAAGVTATPAPSNYNLLLAQSDPTIAGFAASGATGGATGCSPEA
jgi:hypothetical protein